MARVGVMKTIKSMVSSKHNNVELLISRRCLSYVQEGVKQGRRVEEDDHSCCWKPDPRSGIYFPEGQESVMDEVPDKAASFKKTCWFRDIEGVDKSNPDGARLYL